jgi:hypothetical protein
MRIPILREPEIFGRLVATFEGACRDDVTRHDLDEATGEWFDGLTGPAYFAGAEMFGAVYGAFGKPGVFAAMKDLCRLFDLYERAVEKVPDKLSGFPRIPPETVARALWPSANALLSGAAQGCPNVRNS